jgi:hypothetical protein
MRITAYNTFLSSDLSQKSRVRMRATPVSAGLINGPDAVHCSHFESCLARLEILRKHCLVVVVYSLQVMLSESVPGLDFPYGVMAHMDYYCHSPDYCSVGVQSCFLLLMAGPHSSPRSSSHLVPACSWVEVRWVLEQVGLRTEAVSKPLVLSSCPSLILASVCHVLVQRRYCVLCRALRTHRLIRRKRLQEQRSLGQGISARRHLCLP